MPIVVIVTIAITVAMVMMIIIMPPMMPIILPVAALHACEVEARSKRLDAEDGFDFLGAAREVRA